MWTCKICDTEIEDDSWLSCWKCGRDEDTPEDEVEALKLKFSKKEKAGLHCLRCDTVLTYGSTKKFEGNSSGVSFGIGPLGFRFSNSEWYDVYFCPTCGKVEMFVDGIGDELRGEKP